MKTFPREFFSSIAGYNQLMLSTAFYDAFTEYDYILIHQLDAFAFSDELSYWCSLGFDYIGAPWIEADWKDEFSRTRYGMLRRLWGTSDSYVGNGGFSLRRVEKCLKVLRLFRSMAEGWREYEDVFWGLALPAYFPFFKVPREDVALQFSFETNPRECYRRNGGRLPFGCHAWERYDIMFWQPFFERLGYQI